jgi:hypothetical protein
MPPKPIELPPAVARSFLEDMRAYFGEKNAIKRDEIASRAAWLLQPHLPPRQRKLRLFDIKELFEAIKDHA